MWCYVWKFHLNDNPSGSTVDSNVFGKIIGNKKEQTVSMPMQWMRGVLFAGSLSAQLPRCSNFFHLFGDFSSLEFHWAAANFPELIFQLGSWDSWGKNQKRDPEHSLAFCRYVILPSVQGSAWFWLVIHVCVINGPIGQVLSGQVVLARAQVRVHLQSMGWRGRSLLSINFNSQI